MSTKIIGKILEPSKIFTGCDFKLKIKTIKYATYEELKQKSYRNIRTYNFKTLKGD